MQQKTIGIVGGGQLGRMLAQAAHILGFKVIVLDPTPGSPAGLVADGQIVGSFKDEAKILELSKISDFITFELEGVNDEILEKIAKKKPVHPDPKVLRIIKDKFKQKVFLKDHKIKVADFTDIQNEKDCEKCGEVFGYPYLLKAKLDAYDGRGNYVVKNKKDIKNALVKFEGKALYAEKFVPFKKELSVVSARDIFDTVVPYEVVETVHKNNICHIVRSPASISNKTKEKAKNVAKKVLQSLGGVGVFAVEMFLTKKGEVLVNEIAPRVHNSGHHTIESYSISQFEQHIRAITGMSLSKPRPKSKSSVMINILGAREGKAEYRGGEKVEKLGGVAVHIYGKIETRKERKMGHLTVLGKSVKEAEKKAKKAHKYISI